MCFCVWWFAEDVEYAGVLLVYYAQVLPESMYCVSLFMNMKFVFFVAFSLTVCRDYAGHYCEIVWMIFCLMTLLCKARDCDKRLTAVSRFVLSLHICVIFGVFRVGHDLWIHYDATYLELATLLQQLATASHLISARVTLLVCIFQTLTIYGPQSVDFSLGIRVSHALLQQ